MISGAKLPSMLNCRAARTFRGPGGDRDPNPDRPAGKQRREQQLDQHVRSCVDRRSDHRMGEQSRSGEKDPKDDVGDHERRNESGQRLGDEELRATDRGGQDRL
jgi:hypothetical protein